MAFLINIFGWVLIVIFTFLYVSRLLTGDFPSLLSKFTLPASAAALMVSQLLLRRRNLRLAAAFSLISIWFLATLQAYQSHGLRDVVIFAYFAIILLSGLLLGWREGVVVGLLSLAVIWHLALQEADGLRAATSRSPLSFARDLTAVLIATAVLSYVLVNNIDRALSEARNELYVRLRTDEKMQVQARYLTALHETSLALINRLELKPLLELILNRASELLDTPHVGIDLLLPNGEALRQELGLGIYAEWNGTITQKGVGVTGAVWEQEKTIFTKDYSTYSNKNPDAEGIGFGAVLGTPLFSQNKVVGVLLISHANTQKNFTPDQILLFERFASLASLAINNARLYENAQMELLERKSVEEDLRLSEEHLQRQTRYLTALHETTFGLLNRLELNPLLESILLRAGELLETPHVGIDLVLQDGSGLRQELGIGEFVKWNKATIQPGQGMVGKIWQTGDTLLVEDYEAYEDKLAVSSKSGFVTVVGTPMKSGQTVIGTLVVAYRERNRTVTSEQVAVLERLAALASLAIDNARLYENAQTEIIERRIIEQELRSSESRFRKVFENNKIAIALVTLDRGVFLEANDAFWELSQLLPEKALGRSVLEFQLWSNPKEREEFVNKLLEKRSLQDIEAEFTGVDGKTRIALGYYELIDIRDQQCILCMFYDVTEQKQAQTALQNAETRTRAIIASIPDMIFEVSRDGVFLDFMASSELVPVIKPDEFIGKNMQDLFPPHIAQQSLFAIERSLSSGHAQAFEYGLPPEEEIQFFEARVTPVTAETVIIMVRDISQRKWVETEREKLIQELEERNAESEAMRESLSIIVETLDETKTVALVLEQLEKVIPFDSASVQLLRGNELEIVSTRHLTPADDYFGIRYSLNEKDPAYEIITGRSQYVLIDDVQTSSPAFLEDSKDKEIRSWLAIPLKVKGKVIGIIALDGHRIGQFTQKDSDLAVTYANQVAIALENARLFSEVQADLTERKRLIEELENKNAELERFTYTVSHDLKSPVITIRGFLGFLEQDALTGNQARLRSDIKRISDATEKMQSLLNDLLELSRVGRLINPPMAVPFNEIVQETLEIVQGQIQKSMAQVSVQPDMPLVYVDRPRVVEALQNLIDNATKFVGEHPRIEIGQEGTENGMSIFYIRDNGIGIPSEHHERIFGLFNKLDVDSEGTGVGLALVKRIVEVHKGRIWVQSEPGKGTTFRFTLPAPPSDPKPES